MHVYWSSITCALVNHLMFSFMAKSFDPSKCTCIGQSLHLLWSIIWSFNFTIRNFDPSKCTCIGQALHVIWPVIWSFNFTTRNFDPSKCTCIAPLGKGLHKHVNNSVVVALRMFGVAYLICICRYLENFRIRLLLCNDYGQTWMMSCSLSGSILYVNLTFVGGSR